MSVPPLRDDTYKSEAVGVASPYLEMSDVSLSFGGIQALDSLSLRVYRGELVSIIGPNGAGKTSLFDVASGRQRLTKGQVVFLGRDISRWPFHKVAQHGLARTFQTLQLFGRQTVEWHLDVAINGARFQNPFSRRRLMGDESSQQVPTGFLEQMGLAGKGATRPEELTLLERQFLCISMCVVRKPSLILMDEPYAGLRTEEEDRLTSLIQSLRQDNISVMLIEHKMRVVMSISDRVIALSRGSVLAHGTPEDVRSNSKVVDAYLAGG